MKVWESEHTFAHPWERVAAAALRKYPNPLSPAVKSSDVVERGLDEAGRLHSRRLMSTEWAIPGWVSRLIGLRNPSYALEASVVDPRARTLTLRSANLDCTSFISVEEELVYAPDPADPAQTRLSQSTSVTVRGVPFVGQCEQLMTDAMASNASRGREGLEWVIDRLAKDFPHIASSAIPAFSTAS